MTGALKVLVAVVVVWLLSAYVILPALWRHYEHQPCCKHAPKTTRTAEGIPGDPLNVGLIGTEEEVVQAMTGLGWDPADPITAESSFLIAYSVLLDRPYAEAPVSDLFVFGRKQDLAFQKPVGASASRSPPRPVLEFQGARPRRGPPVDRGRDIRPERRVEPLDRHDYPPHRAGHRYRTGRALR